jgi:uncharacterized protein
MEQANMYLKGYLKPYDPVKALNLYLECANAGNVEAMNIVATIYGTGKGIGVDMTKARQWYEKAALAGSGKAWFNLGMIYKYAQGVPQDFTKAFDCFIKAANNNSLSGVYARGYMLYKGLGCRQNYNEAIHFFTRGAYSNELGCMFLLGLCYRNGYGVAIDTGNAKYWIANSANAGYKAAKDEMLITEAENKNIKDSTGITTIQSDTIHCIYKKQNDVNGTFKGLITTYDWSGQYITQIDSLTLSLESEKAKLLGKWTEKNNPTTIIKVQLTDSTIVFNNNVYSKTDRSQPNNPVLWQLRNVMLNACKTDTSVIIYGKLQLYSNELSEPGKPRYIKLLKHLEK